MNGHEHNYPSCSKQTESLTLKFLSTPHLKSQYYLPTHPYIDYVSKSLIQFKCIEININTVMLKLLVIWKSYSSWYLPGIMIAFCFHLVTTVYSLITFAMSDLVVYTWPCVSSYVLENLFKTLNPSSSLMYS